MKFREYLKEKKWGTKELLQGKMASTTERGKKGNYTFRLKNNTFVVSNDIRDDPPYYGLGVVKNNKLIAWIEISRNDYVVATYGKEKDIKAIAKNYSLDLTSFKGK